MKPKKWTDLKESHLKFCREKRREHWRAMRGWGREVRAWEQIKAMAKKAKVRG